MTERNLYNGWFPKKTVRRFFLWMVIMQIGICLLEGTGFLTEWDGFVTRRWYWEKVLQDGNFAEEVLEMCRKETFLPGIGCMVLFILFLAVVSVHKESFFEHWDVTLRRIPKFRGKYLRSKLCLVVLPGVLYVLCFWLQCVWRKAKIKDGLTEQMYEDIAEQIHPLFSIQTIIELILYIVLFSVSVLLCSFTLRSVRKDILGFFVGVIGSVIAGVDLLVTDAIVGQEPWWLCGVLFGGCLVEVLFLIRHVYRKL